MQWTATENDSTPFSYLWRNLARTSQYCEDSWALFRKHIPKIKGAFFTSNKTHKSQLKNSFLKSWHVNGRWTIFIYLFFLHKTILQFDDNELQFEIS